VDEEDRYEGDRYNRALADIAEGIKPIPTVGEGWRGFVGLFKILSYAVEDAARWALRRVTGFSAKPS
jgi:hypothetical protein